MPFHVRGLEADAFEDLFRLTDDELGIMGVRRVHAYEADAYPCRVSLIRVPVGEELLLLHHAHQKTATSPYRASGPIYVSRHGRTAHYQDELPPIMRNRLLSLRAYDADAIMVDAEVGEGEPVLALIDRFLADPNVAHVDAHFARRGCFAARIERD